MYHMQGILEHRINIDQGQSNPWLSLIKGLKHQGPGSVHQMQLATLFSGNVLFSVKSHAWHHGIN